MTRTAAHPPTRTRPAGVRNGSTRTTAPRPRSPHRLVRLLGAMLLVLGASAALAQPPLSSSEFANRLAGWQRMLEEVERELARAQPDPARLDEMRPGVEQLELNALQAANEARARADRVRQLLDALGPSPAAGAPPEDPAVARERDQLRAEFARRDGEQKQADLIATRAHLLLDRIAQTRRTWLAEVLLRRGPSPLAPSVLARAGPQLRELVAHLARAPGKALAPLTESAAGRRAALVTLVLLLGLAAIGWPARALLLRRFGRDPSIAAPSYARRLQAAITIGLAQGLIPSLVALGVLVRILFTRPEDRGLFGYMLSAGLSAFIFFILVIALARAALAPDEPGWRCTSLTDAGARGLYRRLVGLTATVALGFVLAWPASKTVTIPHELGQVYGFFFETVLAGFILALLPKRLWQAERRADLAAPVAAPNPSRLGPALRLLVGLAAMAIPVSGILGYTNLARFLAVHLLFSGGVLGVLVVLHGLTRDITAVLLGAPEAPASVPAAASAADDRSGRLLRFWVLAAFDLALMVAGLLALVLIWGIQWVDMQRWMQGALVGIKVGGMRLSVGDVALAIVLFVGVLGGTRWLQRLLEERIFPQTRLDLGLRSSLKTATGYLGLLVGSMIAISALGLDLSNVALIAGALSVGIGFGLQNVVNNFVSGLILLVERPVKVGDWVVVGANQGYVKRINVRATEIETFQLSSVIIPNSELLSSAVVNWTHKDTSARVEVAVGVAYGSNTDQVREVLLECARRHPKINVWPEPYVLFLNFGDSSLDFELRFFISKADERLSVASDLRFAIDDAFRAADIVIPFPQSDVHLHLREEGAARGQTNAESSAPAGAAGSAPPAPPPGAPPLSTPGHHRG